MRGNGPGELPHVAKQRADPGEATGIGPRRHAISSYRQGLLRVVPWRSSNPEERLQQSVTASFVQMKEFWFYPQVARIERKEEGQVAD